MVSAGGGHDPDFCFFFCCSLLLLFPWDFFCIWMLTAKASPMLIPPRPHPTYAKPMRNSVEGLNQEIEKLVLVTPGQPHGCRPESNLVSFDHLYLKGIVVFSYS